MNECTGRTLAIVQVFLLGCQTVNPFIVLRSAAYDNLPLSTSCLFHLVKIIYKRFFGRSRTSYYIVAHLPKNF